MHAFTIPTVGLGLVSFSRRVHTGGTGVNAQSEKEHTSPHPEQLSNDTGGLASNLGTS